MLKNWPQVPGKAKVDAQVATGHMLVEKFKAVYATVYPIRSSAMEVKDLSARLF